MLLAVAAWILAGLEAGLRDALVIGQTGISPSFVFVLMAFIAMTAPRPVVLWAAVALGLLLDLVFEVPLKQAGSNLTMIGPHALAYALGAQLIVVLRGIMIRRNPLTLGFLSLVGALVANLVLWTIFSLRSVAGAPLVWETKHQIVAALGSAAYTGLLGIVLAFVLFPLAGPLGLPSQQQRRFAVRR
jgi:rod shape-determining protein MreD